MTNTKKLNKRQRSFAKRFGSKKVYITYLVCFIITILTMLASILSWLRTDRLSDEKVFEHIGLCVLALLLMNIPVFLRTKFNFQIPAFLQIVVEIFIVAHFVLGEIYRFYDHSILFDKLLHISAGVIIAVLGFSIVYGFSQSDAGKVKLSPFFVAMFSFCFAVSILTLWEIFEYSMDSLFNMNMQRWNDALTVVEIEGENKTVTSVNQGSGLVDTMIDLIVGTTGAAIISILGGMWVYKYPDNTRFYVRRDRKTSEN